MENAIAVANFFIKKSLATGIPVTPMKVVKLVYIAHGWYLGLTGEPLIAEGVQAWKYGPVVPSIYYYFRDYGGNQINQPAHTGRPYGQVVYYSLANSDLEPFLNKIWEVYGKFSGVDLSAMTHQKGTPWDEAWNALGGKEKMELVIPNNLIKDHYQQLAQRNVSSATVNP